MKTPPRFLEVLRHKSQDATAVPHTEQKGRGDGFAPPALSLRYFAASTTFS